MNDILDNILKHRNKITFIGILIYAFGFIYLFEYYASFHIDIFSYLSLEDIFIKSIEILISISFSVILINYIAILLINIIKFVWKAITKKTLSSIYKIYLLCILSLLLFAMKWNTNIAILLLLSAFILFIFDKRYSINPILLYGMPLSCTMLFVQNKQEKVFKGNSSTLIEHIQLTDTTFSISPSSSLSYIGETQGALFLYNKSNKESIIIPKGEIKRITTKSSLDKGFTEGLKRYLIDNY